MMSIESTIPHCLASNPNCVFSFAAALALLSLSACGAKPSQEPSSPGPASSSAAASEAPAPVETQKAPRCFLESSQATEYVHDLLVNALSSADFDDPRILRASTPENLKVIENSLGQEMMKITCKKPWTDDLDTIEGALLVAGLMKFDDKQWDALVRTIPVPPSYRGLPSETQDWLKDPTSLESLKSFSRNDKTADELIAASAKELKCAKDKVSVKVKTRKLADVEGCHRKATLKYDGGWKKEAP